MPLKVGHKVIDVGVTSQEVSAENEKRVSVLLQNNHANQNIYLKYNSEAVVNEGIRLAANGGAYEINLTNPWYGKIYAIASGATTRLMITEVSK